MDRKKNKKKNMEVQIHIHNQKKAQKKIQQNKSKTIRKENRKKHLQTSHARQKNIITRKPYQPNAQHDTKNPSGQQHNAKKRHEKDNHQENEKPRNPPYEEDHH